MATAAQANTHAAYLTAVPAGTSAAAQDDDRQRHDQALPLPRWLERVYFIFPVVLYIPDVIFNYFVYSDGGKIPNATPFLQVSQLLLWSFMAIGIVGMAYLLSVLAPWHWGRGHHIQAIFCGLGVLIATAVTTWNSLSFRSTGFVSFRTDTWVQQLWPQLSGFSLTMLLVAIAPPFWGLFWAVVQPTQRNRGLHHLRESHAERLLRLEQETEIKRVRAESNAKVRAAQLRGTAQTLAAARDQASELWRGRGGAAGDASAPRTTVTAAAPAQLSAPHDGDDTEEPEAAAAPLAAAAYYPTAAAGTLLTASQPGAGSVQFLDASAIMAARPSGPHRGITHGDSQPLASAAGRGTGGRTGARARRTTATTA